MNKFLIGTAAALTGALAFAATPAAAAVAPAATTINVSDSFAAIGLTVGVIGNATAQDGGVFVLPVTNVSGAAVSALAGGLPSAEMVSHQGSGLSLMTDDGITASLTDLIVDESDGVVSGLVRIDSYLPNGDVLYGRMDLFTIDDVDGDLTFDMVVSDMAGETLLTYLGVDIGDAAFAKAVVGANLETPLPGALALFGTALAGGAIARRRAAR